MRLAIVQLSDIHIKSNADEILGRASEIATAVRALNPQPDSCLVAYTGDIAFSGTHSQYAAAETFATAVQSALRSLEFAPRVARVAIPGNP